MIASDRLLAPQHQTRLGGLFLEVPGKYLIDADAAAQHRPFLQRGPGQDIARLPRMNAHTRGVLVEQSRNDIQPRPEGLQRFKALTQLHLRARTLRPPIFGADPIAHEQSREPLRMHGSGRLAPQQRESFEPREGDGDAKPAKDSTTGGQV